MAGSVSTTPGYELQPSAKQIATQANYITDFNFMQTELPELYEKEFARYGDRTIASFLRGMKSEMPFASDLIKWTEQGRLHTAYVNCESDAAAGSHTATITVNDTITGGIAIRAGQTIMINSAAGASNKAGVMEVDLAAGTFDVAYYATGGQTYATGDVLSMFIYGSEFRKGTGGMKGSLEAETNIFENSAIILKDHYEVAGSDMAQIGWVEVEDGNGGTGYLWYMKSKGDTRTRFEEYLETSGIEAVPAETGSGIRTQTANTDLGDKGSDGLLYSIGKRGNIWAGGNPETLPEFDEVVARLDKQGKISQNMLFINRKFDTDIDDMLATLNGYNGTGAANSASFGAFENSDKMALNLGFTGFRRSGYDFYKTSWKYLNDPTMRGSLTTGGINGVLVPAGTKSVYDQVAAKNMKRPFLHCRYRKSSTEDRKLKTWVIGSAGGASNSDKDAMEVHWLSERMLCTLGANNFFKFNQ
tara:strand:+ start:970 stop:2388 length:1419 start_codon:yes stop_codon:yes gene_type:complete